MSSTSGARVQGRVDETAGREDRDRQSWRRTAVRRDRRRGAGCQGRSNRRVERHIKLVEGDGFTAETDAATYDTRDATVHAPGPVTFHHNRLSGSGMGMLYREERDVLTILQKSEVSRRA